MTTPRNPTQSPVPTSQRPINGAVSGGIALIVSAALLSQGVTPELAAAGGMAASGVAATIGDATRKHAQRTPPTTLLGEILITLLTRVG